MMKILCVCASIFLAVNGFRIERDSKSEQPPKLVECRGRDGNPELVYPSIDGPQTIVTSSNFGKGNYTSFEKCRVQFKTKDQPINLRLNFTDFELEVDRTCRYDAVCVNGIEQCGTTLDDKVLSYYVPANSTFTFSFKSDSCSNRRGFRVLVDAIPAESDKGGFYYEDWCLTRYGSDYGNNQNGYNGYSAGDKINSNNYNGPTTGDYDNSNNYNGPTTGDYDKSTNYNGYTTGDYDNSNNNNDYSTGVYDYGNIDDDYSTGDSSDVDYNYDSLYDYDYSTGDTSDVDYNYDSLYDYDYSIEDYTDEFSSAAEPVYDDEYAQPE